MGENRFVDNGDGTIIDTLTQLMWMRNDSYLACYSLTSITLPNLGPLPRFRMSLLINLNTLVRAHR